MPNTWDIVGDWLAMSRIETLTVAGRSTSYDLTDSTVSSTAWEEFDMTAIIGTDVIGAIWQADIDNTTGASQTILSVREIGDTVGTDSISARTLIMQAGTVSSTLQYGVPGFLIPCRGTDPGKVEYTEHSSWPVSTVRVLIWGRVRP